jgi:histidinol dehydrogenase
VSPRRLDTGDPGFASQLDTLLRYESGADSSVDGVVAAILADIVARGDVALVEYTSRLDGFEVADVAALEITRAEMDACLAALPNAQRAALLAAAERIRAFHEHQLASSWSYTEPDGTELGQRVCALDRVGLYVPGGKASYPSSLLMNAIPARVAGVSELILVCPTPLGVRNPLVLAAAAIAGIDRAWAVGGAQAIGALAFGTATIPRVDKIVGPGNAYVAAAKRRVFGTVGIDMIAGPSEILVIADATTPPDWIAMDLFSQAEHDESAQAILLCPDPSYIERVGEAMERLLPGLARGAIIRQSLSKRCALIRVRDLAEACALANRIAPEHLELSVRDPDALLPAIRHAGAVFMGPFSSEAIGDYCAGPNHVLPTAGTARFSQALGVYDFQKRSSTIKLSAAAAVTLGHIAIELATGEGLGAHAEAARLRLAQTSGVSEGAPSRVARVIRADVRAMQAYPVADATGMVKLDLMESPYALPVELRAELARELSEIAVNRYPQPRAEGLRETLRATMAIPEGAGLILGNGSDELISLLAMAVARPGASILSPVPSFVMYEASARLAQVRFVGVPVHADFSLDVERTLAAITRHQPAVVYIAYPNNPTGTLYPRAEIEAIIAASPGLVVVDEAYQAFAPDTFLADVASYDNLAVMRTVSKSGLAGARLGYLAAPKPWTDELDKVRPPFNVNVFTQCYVRFALLHQEVLVEQAQRLKQARGELFAKLEDMAGIEAFASSANFILFRVVSSNPEAANRVFEGLCRRKVLIKNLARAHPLLGNCLRVTVSSPQENALFLAALAASMAP